MTQDPSPWSVVLEYSKTVITVATGLLTITGTFASKLYDSSSATHPPIELILAWGLLLVSIAFCLFAIGRLTHFLRQKENGAAEKATIMRRFESLQSFFSRNRDASSNASPSPSLVLFLSNAAYFALFLAACFFVVAISSRPSFSEKDSKRSQHPVSNEKTPREYVEFKRFIIKSFPEGEDRLPESPESVALITYLRTHSKQLISCLIIGSVDKRLLRHIAKKKFVSNVTLASSRGLRVLEYIEKHTAMSSESCAVLSSGGRGTEDLPETELERIFSDDRAVQVRLVVLKDTH